MATETQVEEEYLAASHEMLPNEALARVVYDNLVEIGVPEFTEEEKQFVMDCQKNEGQAPFWDNSIKEFRHYSGPVVDSSEYSWVCPYNMLVLNLGPGPGWHNWMVTACAGNTHGQKALDRAGQIMASAAADIICDPALLSKAKAEHAEVMKGRVYKSLMPAGAPVPLDMNTAAMEKYRPLY
jgi:aminobenzoyl-glutamate utilization protein B